MIDLTGTSAELVKFADTKTPLWLARLRADSLSLGEVNQLFGSDVFTDWDTNVWQDLMESLSLGWVELLLKGGVAVQAENQLRLRNEGRLSNMVSSFSLENDLLELFLLFKAGSNDADDLIPIGTGLIDGHPSEVNNWTLQAVDGSRRDWQPTPNRPIAGESFPLAPNDTSELPFYVPYGVFDIGPYDNVGTKRHLVPCQCVDFLVAGVGGMYTAGITNYSAGQVYQGYDSNRWLAEVVDYTPTTIDGYGAFFTVDSLSRRLISRPARKDGANTVTSWSAVADGKTATSSTVAVGKTLVLYFAGVPKSGLLTAANVSIFATGGTYDWSLDHTVDNLGSGTGVSGDVSITGIDVSRWATVWDHQLLKITITPVGGDVEVEELELELIFDDQTGLDGQTGLPLFAKCQGAYDDVSRYEDGGLIVQPPAGVGAALAAGGALAETTYYYVVTAVDAGGLESTVSAEVSATPAGANLTIDLSWTAVVWAASYNVYRSTSSDTYGGTSLAGNVTAAAFSDTGVTLVTGTPATVVVFENPVDQAHAFLRRKDSLSLSTTYINTTSFDIARGKRALYKFAWVHGIEKWESIESLTPFLQEAGLHLYKSAGNEWTIVARDKDAAPQHALIDQWNVAVVNADADYKDYKPETTVDRVRNRDLINQYEIHGQLDLTTNTYNVREIASCNYQITGTAATDPATGEVVLDSGSLTDAGVVAGWVFYFENDQAYVTTAAPSTALRVAVDPLIGAEVYDNPSGTTFWAGTNLDPDLLRSRRRYKALKSLGRPTTNARDQNSGYQSRFIKDQPTAGLMVDHWKDFHAELPTLPTTAAFIGHIDIEPGDIVVMHDQQLPDNRQGDLLTTLAAQVDPGDADMLCTDEEMVSTDDVLLLGYGTQSPEIVFVGDLDTGSGRWDITRAQSNTEAGTHLSGTSVIRLRHKYEVISMRRPQPDDPVVRLKLLQLPYSYKPVLRFTEDDGPDTFDEMTDREKALYRAWTNNDGYMDERDIESVAVFGDD